MSDARSDELLALRAVVDAACAFMRRTSDAESLLRLASAVEAYEKLPRKGVLRVRRTRGVGGLTSNNPGTAPTAPNFQEGSEPTSRSDVSTGGKTWLSEYMRVYARCYGENPSPVAVKRMARTFKQLEVVYPRADVVRRFENYLANTTIRYYSVERFADTYAGWNLHRREGGDRRLDQRPGESVDAYAARVLNG